jgi:hypothetical protein
MSIGKSTTARLTIYSRRLSPPSGVIPEHWPSRRSSRIGRLWGLGVPEQAALVQMIDRFLSGDHSRALVNEIEGVVTQSFQSADWYDDVGTALALYAPAERSGEYVLAAEPERILRRLRDQLKEHS